MGSSPAAPTIKIPMRANKQSRHPVKVEIARAALVVGDSIKLLTSLNVLGWPTGLGPPTGGREFRCF